jgi:outer membrane protein OmpA-like peptidoglycan-associated protein
MEHAGFRTRLFVAAGLAGALSLLQGCIATRDWVQEQIDPVSGRVSQTEARIGQAENQIGGLSGRMSGAEATLGQHGSRFGQVEGKLGQLDAKTERALSAISHLRLDRKFVIDMKEGANFGFNSATLPNQAKKEIDGFMSDLKGDAAGMENSVFLIAGHADSVGSENYNYELGKRRAEAVSRYLITQKKVNPLRVVAVSYGSTAPVAENNTSQGRAKNRRVEILVYRDEITSEPAASTPREQSPMGENLSQRQ